MVRHGRAFDHALLALKQLPAGQKRAWKALFDQYVFNEDNDALAHLPEHSKGPVSTPSLTWHGDCGLTY